jgi:hypothetical protein
VDQAAANAKPKSQEPKNQEHTDNCPKHEFLSGARSERPVLKLVRARKISLRAIQAAMLSEGSISLAMVFRSRSAASWQAVHAEAQGIAARRFG